MYISYSALKKKCTSRPWLSMYWKTKHRWLLCGGSAFKRVPWHSQMWIYCLLASSVCRFRWAEKNVAGRDSLGLIFFACCSTSGSAMVCSRPCQEWIRNKYLLFGRQVSRDFFCTLMATAGFPQQRTTKPQHIDNKHYTFCAVLQSERFLLHLFSNLLSQLVTYQQNH